MKTIADLPGYQNQIEGYCQRVREEFNPTSIILHSSYARGTNSPTSDIDLIVIGDGLPRNFIRRLYELNRLRDGTTPIEVVGYTLVEWEQMMDKYHLTVLEALHWGIPLHGEALFSHWKSIFTQWQSSGLRREERSWVIPQAIHSQLHPATRWGANNPQSNSS